MSVASHGGALNRRQVVGILVATGAGAVVPVAAAAPAGADDPASPGSGRATVGNLRVDGRGDDPLGVDDTAPRLSWQLTNAPAGWAQAAYRIRAAGSERELTGGSLLWDSGVVRSPAQFDVAWGGAELRSRQAVVWQVRVWSERGEATPWSRPARWEMGLLERGDWGEARWIEHPGRGVDEPLPLFARAFTVDGRRGARVTRARLYLAGVGLHDVRMNGAAVTDEVLAPGNSNYQLSTEYRAYDVTRLVRTGANALGVALGHGTALVTRSVRNEETGRTAPYSWWQSQPKGSGTLAAPAPAGASTVRVSDVTGYHLGGTINIDTGDGGDRLESREITAIGTAGADGGGITFRPALDAEHAAGASVTGSGNPLASTDPSAGAAVSPRMIARLELTAADGSVDVVVSDRSWVTALGPTVTSNWYSGTDHDSRREQPGWTEPGADLGDTARRRDGTPVGWVAAGIAPPPNLTTELVWRVAEPVRVVDRVRPVRVTQPRPGVWVFDFGQNFAGWPEITLDGTVPAGTTVTMRPAESLAADGTVDQRSLMGGGSGRGTDVFATYTTHGDPDGETWHPTFDYFGMQWLQVTGLPDGYTPTARTVTGLQLRADTPVAGALETSDERINRVHRMARYSIASNLMSTFTDCPGREKLAYPADYTQPFGSLARNFGFDAYLRTMQRHLVEGQSRAGENIGNVALKAPVYDWGYLGRFGDEVNWGNGIVLVPWLLHETYGDTQLMERHYPEMRAFLDYLRNRKAGTGADAHLVDGALADWVAADGGTSGRITGTWGYFQTVDRMARMAALLGRTADADEYRELAAAIRDAFNAAFYNRAAGRYTAEGDRGTAGATQAAQALALDEDLVPAGERGRVLDALVELVHAYRPFGGGPHLSAGTIGLAPTVRALTAGGRDDVLWDVLREDTRPGYGFFLTPTTANPEGLTTVPEQWDLGNSKNHMILLQIEEWFHRGLAGIRQARGSVGYRDLVIDPRVVGDLSHVAGSYRTPHGEVASAWTRRGGTFRLTVRVPPNSTAEVRLPTGGERAVTASRGATFLRVEGDRALYRVASGSHDFTAPDASSGSARP
ncbi:family 78 glycoside hydrolase catalytic domain [Streptomyces millisiae]|uniref:alpha-L-rhamnosidase n=1 Tax=Streptomyces millisiae TaxID=3075542 RepID=A0ABU2LUB1_9ACTN|nr:family 78 glycoside hydrolase catalytic domain [Streptomyces sp. DSM 44918]MDT0321169.1 family 78 glycoside hydrolase catalytic domain [Streptomyces sp. DSM 44918]